MQQRYLQRLVLVIHVTWPLVLLTRVAQHLNPTAGSLEPGDLRPTFIPPPATAALSPAHTRHSTIRLFTLILLACRQEESYRPSSVNNCHSKLYNPSRNITCHMPLTFVSKFSAEYRYSWLHIIQLGIYQSIIIFIG